MAIDVIAAQKQPYQNALYELGIIIKTRFAEDGKDSLSLLSSPIFVVTSFKSKYF